MSLTLNQVISPHLPAPVTLHLNPGIHGVIGPNGVGKTTLLRLIAGHHRPRGGSIEAERTALARAGADACFAGHRIADHLAVAQVGHPLLDAALFTEVLDIAALTPQATISTLSVGHRQLVSVATALAANAPITLLDEPFNGLDVRTRTALRQLLIRLAGEREKWTLLLSSHRAEDLAGLVGDVIPIQAGVVLEPVDLDEIRNHYPTLTGPAAAVREIAGEHPIIAEAVLGPTLRLTLGQPLNSSEERRAAVEEVAVSQPDDQALIDLLSMTPPEGS